jgi:tRNA(Ile)-lysidine synthase
MVQLLKKIRLTIEQNQLLAAGETVVVGVSGGPDSLCLLHALCRLRSEYDLRLHVAHLHHGLRGPDADADAEFVRALAADWGLPCTVERADVPALAAEHRLAVEEAARRARYATLSRVAEQAGARTIAVGHNADDQAETVLMHWLRGSGLAGLRGMLPLTLLGDYRLLEGDAGLPSFSPHLRLIRPLLEVSRAEIEAYCDHYGLKPRFDRSNLDTTYFRNWLRHEVIPLLARHNPNVQEVMRRSARVIADDYALLRSLLEETWPRIVLEEGSRIVFDLTAWRTLPTALQRSTLREAIHRLRRSLRNINFVHVENALLVARDGTTGDQATLPRGLMLTVGYERFTVADVGVPELLPDWPLLPPDCAPLPIVVPGVTSLPESDWMLEAAILGRGDLPGDWEANVDPWRAFLDAQAVGADLALRTRRPGDRFQPLGMDGHTAKLADFLTNQKVPRAARDRLPLLVGGWGIAWVCGLRLDESARVQDATERVLSLRFVRD